MDDAGLDLLPVVSRANVRSLVAIVTLQDVLNAYGLRDRSAAELCAPPHEPGSGS